MTVTNDDILRTLEKIRTDSRRQRYMRAPDTYKTFMPQQLPTKQRDNSQYYTNLDTIAQIGQNATDVATQRAQNRKAAQQAKEQSQALTRAKKESAFIPPPVTKLKDGLSAVTRQYNPGGIQIGNGKKVVKGVMNPYAAIKTYHVAGRNVQLNSSVASRFINLVNALQGKGYKIYSLGGYSNRNIAGTNRKSLHSYGLAMDINPGSNPVTYGGQGAVRSNLPPGVAALAAKYGLAWGGNWNGSKQDPMHFSVPAFGTK